MAREDHIASAIEEALRNAAIVKQKTWDGVAIVKIMLRVGVNIENVFPLRGRGF